jgi:hypothetical protein
MELEAEKRHMILTLPLPNRSERLCSITLMNSHHRRRHWLQHSSQRSCRPKLSRARRKLIGASHRFGLLQYLQIFIHYLQSIGEQHSANGQPERQVIYFRTDDMPSTRDWKAIPPALDINQPTILFTDAAESQRPNPVTNRSSSGSWTHPQN